MDEKQKQHGIDLAEFERRCAELAARAAALEPSKQKDDLMLVLDELFELFHRLGLQRSA